MANPEKTLNRIGAVEKALSWGCTAGAAVLGVGGLWEASTGSPILGVALVAASLLLFASLS